MIILRTISFVTG